MGYVNAHKRGYSSRVAAIPRRDIREGKGPFSLDARDASRVSIGPEDTDAVYSKDEKDSSAFQTRMSKACQDPIFLTLLCVEYQIRARPL